MVESGLDLNKLTRLYLVSYMQGVVFTLFNDMIVEKFGMEMWNMLLEESSPESGGVYTSSIQYKDEELMEMVSLLSSKTEIPVNTLVKVFGNYLFPKLLAGSPVDVSKSSDIKSLLRAVGDVIHVEVKRLYPDAYLPKIKLNDIDKTHAELLYQSKRQLCMLCEGLIEGAAEHFDTGLSVSQSTCMHQGDDHCTLCITLH